MTVENSLYTFIASTFIDQNEGVYHGLRAKKKTDRHNAEYVLLQLKCEDLVVLLKDRIISIKEHHISIYKDYDTSHKRDYFFHYTAKCAALGSSDTRFIMHVYFDKQGRCVDEPQFTPLDQNSSQDLISWILERPRRKNAFVQFSEHQVNEVLPPILFDLRACIQKLTVEYEQAKQAWDTHCGQHWDVINQEESIKTSLVLLNEAKEKLVLLAVYSERCYKKTMVGFERMLRAYERSLNVFYNEGSFINQFGIIEEDQTHFSESHVTILTQMAANPLALTTNVSLSKKDILDKIEMLTRLHEETHKCFELILPRPWNDNLVIKFLEFQKQLGNFFIEIETFFAIPEAEVHIASELYKKITDSLERWWSAEEHYGVQALTWSFFSEKYDLAVKLMVYVPQLDSKHMLFFLKKDCSRVFELIAESDFTFLEKCKIVTAEGSLPVSLSFAAVKFGSLKCLKVLMRYKINLLALAPDGLPVVHHFLDSENMRDEIIQFIRDTYGVKQTLYVWKILVKYMELSLSSMNLSDEQRQRYHDALLRYKDDSILLFPHSDVPSRSLLQIDSITRWGLSVLGKDRQTIISKWRAEPVQQERLRILEENVARITILLNKSGLSILAIYKTGIEAIQKAISSEVSRDVEQEILDEGEVQKIILAADQKLNDMFSAFGLIEEAINICREGSRVHGHRKQRKLQNTLEKISKELIRLLPEVNMLLPKGKRQFSPQFDSRQMKIKLERLRNDPECIAFFKMVYEYTVESGRKVSEPDSEFGSVTDFEAYCKEDEQTRLSNV